MATHSSVLAWRIPGMGEPGGLPSMGSHRVGHDWGDLAAAAAAVLLKATLFSMEENITLFWLVRISRPLSLWCWASGQGHFVKQTMRTSWNVCGGYRSMTGLNIAACCYHGVCWESLCEKHILLAVGTWLLREKAVFVFCLLRHLGEQVRKSLRLIEQSQNDRKGRVLRTRK